MKIRCGTLIQTRVNGKWSFFSQQAWKEAQYDYEIGETPMSDEDYLKACQDLEPDAELRIAQQEVR